MPSNRVIAILPVLALLVSAAPAQETRPVAKPTDPSSRPDQPTSVSLAVLDYDATLPGNDELGSQMAEILAARLSIESNLKLVERTELDKVIDEHRLALTGLVDDERAARVGRLVGAQMLVTGKAFVLDDDLLIVTKLIGVETGRVVGTIRKVDLGQAISEVAMRVADDVVQLVLDRADNLLPDDEPIPDPVADIRKLLGDAPPPSVAVVVTEDHRRRPEQPRTVIVDLPSRPKSGGRFWRAGSRWSILMGTTRPTWRARAIGIAPRPRLSPKRTSW